MCGITGFWSPSRYVPPSLWDRPKTGFGIPLHAWYGGADAARAFLQESRGVLAQAGVDATAFPVPPAGISVADFSFFWNLHMLSAWVKSEKCA